jgi:hypothetical protein
MIRSMDREYTDGQMAEVMKEAGKMENRMESEFSVLKKEGKSRDCGAKGKESSGLIKLKIVL